MPLLEVNNLVCRYGNHTALNNISFALQRGQILGFLGPNGAGKSTTMKIISGVQQATKGTVLINGVDINKQPQQAKNQLGFLPEIPPVYPDLTVQEYLVFCAKLHHIKKSHCLKAIQQAMDDCDLHSVSKKLIGQLSKGFQQRVGIAQAIIHRPDIIILDEPTVGLDPLQINKIRTLITELSQHHGIILSTHILSEVSAICSHVQIINNGQLVYKNDLKQLQQNSHQSYQIDTTDGFNINQLKHLQGIQNITPIHSLESIFLEKTGRV